MAALRFLAKLALYYGALALAVTALLWLVPGLRENLPIGRVQALITKGAAAFAEGQAVKPHFAHVASMSASLIWLVGALLGALLTALPVSWVYMEIRNPEDYDQSLAGVVVLLPLVVASIVVIVQDSLALSFSLAGIAGAVRFRNSLKSSGDLLFILLGIGIGLSAGIGAMELAITASIVFNLAFVALWFNEYGERKGMKRYMSDFDPAHIHGKAVEVDVTQVSVTETVIHAEPSGEHHKKHKAEGAPSA